MADEILRQGITGISDIVVKPGLINVDFADVRSVMQNAGPALMGIGRGFGKTRARDAALAAVSSPLLDFPIERAKGAPRHATRPATAALRPTPLRSTTTPTTSLTTPRRPPLQAWSSRSRATRTCPSRR